jgi:lipid-A-disaccharide synthase
MTPESSLKPTPLRVLVSAGESSGDLYAAALVQALRRRLPEAEFFGCAGPRMERAGVRPVVKAGELSVVGLVEVISHIPRIYKEFRKIVEVVEQSPPDLAILTDAPDFHLRLAPKLRAAGTPVVYLVAPQVWAWRKRRIRSMRRNICILLCIFPFEEDYFRLHGMKAYYVGHPLTQMVRPALSRVEFFNKHRLNPGVPLVVLLPGSRPGEVTRHLRELLRGAALLVQRRPCQFVLATPPESSSWLPQHYFTEPNCALSIQHAEGETWDAIAHADLALAASGTVTIEAAILGTPMVTFYKVTPLSWWMGRLLVDVPFFSMVNLVAGQRVVPELIQNEMKAEKLAAEAERLLSDPSLRDLMRRGLAAVRTKLDAGGDPIERAASLVLELIENDWQRKLVPARP